MSVAEELQQNNPARTRISIYLRDVTTSDGDLAEALEQNPFVTEIVLNLTGVQRTDWDSLLRVIATRSNLEKVTVRDIPARRNAPAALVLRSTLRAIQQNTAIQRVELLWVHLPVDISTFVDNASSITSFSIYGCDMEAAELERGARRLAAALQHNINIESLEIRRLDDIFTIPILEGLRSNVSLKTLIFSPCVSFSDAASHAIHQLLESTTSIQRFELVHANISERLFRPIAQGIIQSKTVCELKFAACLLNSQNLTAQFQSVLQNKRNLTSLSVEGCYFEGRQYVQGDIISALSRPDSLIRCFEYLSRGHFTRIQLVNMLRAIERSKLERFKIGTIQSQQQMRTLTQSIPSMKLKELVIQYEWYDDDRLRNAKEELLQAVKNNFTLLSVKGETSNAVDLFNQRDKQRLAVYANRNENLDQWVDHPEAVGQKAWPEALTLAERAGPGALFCGLRSVLGRDYVHLKGGRKRKRVQN